MSTAGKAKVVRIPLGTQRRILAISDVHGKLSWLRELLKKVGFCSDDILILLGDLVERGEESLATVRYVMELCQKENVYFLTGNCDTLAMDLLVGNKGIGGWLRNHPESHMLQLAQEGGFSYKGEEDIRPLGEFLFTRYPEEMVFLTQSPTILEAEHYVFVHGGVPSMEHMDELDAYPCLKNDNFLGQGYSFPKYCVVGHWPTTLYREEIPCCNPIVQRERKILSIDGGGGVKIGGQLNALVIPNGASEEFSFFSYDDYPKAIALDGQEASRHPVTIRWVDNEIDILRRGEEFSFCRQKSTGKTLWLLTSYLRSWGGRDYCEDSTDYCLGVKPGEELSVVEKTSSRYFVKKDGTLGWYTGRLKMR